MLLKKRTAFLTPIYSPNLFRIYRFSRSPLQRAFVILQTHPTKQGSRRTYTTQPPNFSGSSANPSGGIPLGQIPLGKAAPSKGIAIKDDITKSWKELSIPQKIVRTGTQTTNFVVVILSIGVLVQSMP